MEHTDKPSESVDARDRRDPSSSNQYRRSIFGVPVTVTVSVGQARMSVAEILQLHEASIVPLSAKLDDPIELKVDDRLIAYGDLIETGDGGLAVKITEVLERDDDPHD